MAQMGEPGRDPGSWLQPRFRLGYRGHLGSKPMDGEYPVSLIPTPVYATAFQIEKLICKLEELGSGFTPHHRIVARRTSLSCQHHSLDTASLGHSPTSTCSQVLWPVPPAACCCRSAPQLRAHTHKHSGTSIPGPPHFRLGPPGSPGVEGGRYNLSRKRSLGGCSFSGSATGSELNLLQCS